MQVLIYVGTSDFIANWIGNERWTLSMEWPGRDAFATTPLTDWTVDGHENPAGKTRSFGNFTFATIYGAGHFVRPSYLSLLRKLTYCPKVPHDQPVEALDMLQKWLANEAF